MRAYTLTKFGLTINKDVRQLSVEELRTYLSEYGVITFRNQELSDDEYVNVMQSFGSILSYLQQHVTKKYVSPTHQGIILMHNQDFLGKTRGAWHIDHPYLGPKNLPIRSLYSYNQCSPNNQTEFADLKYLSAEIIKKFPNVVNAKVKYVTDKPMEFCVPYQFSKTPIVRYDPRMTSVDSELDITAIRAFALDILSTNDVPKFSIDWQLNDLVIFDNNQAIHRRSMQTGEVLHKRLTTDHWL
jgi:alpha-ketoglutarate-dependent taurine dioxygenase